MPLKLHPSYDCQGREWFVEHEGLLLAAPTLAKLKTKFEVPVVFKDYFPNGFAYSWSGDGRPMSRKPVIILRKMIRSHGSEAAFTTPIASADVPRPIKTLRAQLIEQPHKPRGSVVDREAVLTLAAEAYPVIDIAMHLGCTTRVVNLIKAQARTQGDYRGSVKPRLQSSLYKRKFWTAEDDVELRRLAEVERWTAERIGRHFKVSRNSVIGRCHRRDITLHGIGRFKKGYEAY